MSVVSAAPSIHDNLRNAFYRSPTVGHALYHLIDNLQQDATGGGWGDDVRDISTKGVNKSDPAAIQKLIKDTSDKLRKVKNNPHAAHYLRILTEYADKAHCKLNHSAKMGAGSHDRSFGGATHKTHENKMHDPTAIVSEIHSGVSDIDYKPHKEARKYETPHIDILIDNEDAHWNGVLVEKLQKLLKQRDIQYSVVNVTDPVRWPTTDELDAKGVHPKGTLWIVRPHSGGMDELYAKIVNFFTIDDHKQEHRPHVWIGAVGAHVSLAAAHQSNPDVTFLPPLLETSACASFIEWIRAIEQVCDQYDTRVVEHEKKAHRVVHQHWDGPQEASESDEGESDDEEEEEKEDKTKKTSEKEAAKKKEAVDAN
jgi:hypothetical protein